MDASLAHAAVDLENPPLDPQLLALQNSSQHILPTPFASTERTQMFTSIGQSAETLQEPSHFNWNDFSIFDALNHSLSILNPANDTQTQIDRLTGNIPRSGAETAWSSIPNVKRAMDLSDISNAQATPFRIHASTEVQVRPVRGSASSGHPIEKKLDEETWESLFKQAKETEAVGLSKYRLTNSK